jgi:hypothetical protein
MKHRFFNENSDLVLFTVHLYVCHYNRKATFSIMGKKICIRVLYKINYLNNASFDLGSIRLSLTFKLADSNIDSEKMKVLVQVLKKKLLLVFTCLTAELLKK